MTKVGGRREGGIPVFLGTANSAAFFRYHQAQMHPQPTIGGPCVGPYMSPWMHYRILDLQEEREDFSKAIFTSILLHVQDFITSHPRGPTKTAMSPFVSLGNN